MGIKCKLRKLKQTISQSEEQVKCRIDHYQTRDQVHMTVYAKQVDKNQSSILVGEDRVDIHFFL